MQTTATMPAILLLSLAIAAQAGGMEPTHWTYEETSPGSQAARIVYTLTAAGDQQTLVCTKGARTLTSLIDAEGCTIKWTKVDGSTRVEFPPQDSSGNGTAQATGITSSGGHPWLQDLTLLAPFVLGPAKELRFVAFPDFLDARLKASDLTRFKANKVKVETVVWGNGSGPAWRIHVTFDDLRSMFWGADYWFRTSDGLLVRYQEVRGGPGTPTTTGVLVAEAAP